MNNEVKRRASVCMCACSCVCVRVRACLRACVRVWVCGARRGQAGEKGEVNSGGESERVEPGGAAGLERLVRVYVYGTLYFGI